MMNVIRSRVRRARKAVGELAELIGTRTSRTELSYHGYDADEVRRTGNHRFGWEEYRVHRQEVNRFPKGTTVRGTSKPGLRAMRQRGEPCAICGRATDDPELEVAYFTETRQAFNILGFTVHERVTDVEPRCSHHPPGACPDK